MFGCRYPMVPRTALHQLYNPITFVWLHNRFAELHNYPCASLFRRYFSQSRCVAKINRIILGQHQKTFSYKLTAAFRFGYSYISDCISHFLHGFLVLFRHLRHVAPVTRFSLFLHIHQLLLIPFVIGVLLTHHGVNLFSAFICFLGTGTCINIIKKLFKNSNFQFHANF